MPPGSFRPSVFCLGGRAKFYQSAAQPLERMLSSQEQTWPVRDATSRMGSYFYPNAMQGLGILMILVEGVAFSCVTTV